MFFICMETKSNMYFLVFARYSLRVSDASQIFKRYNAQMPRGLQVVIFLHFGLLSVLRLTLWTSRSQQARGLVSTIKAIYSWNWILHNVKSTNNDKSVKSFSSSLFDKFRKLVINKNGGCSLFSQQRHCVPIWRWLLMVPRRKVGSCKNNPISNHLTI